MNAIFKCLLFVLYFLHSICYNPLMSLFYALVAQLDRVTDSDSVGRTFESCRAYQKFREII